MHEAAIVKEIRTDKYWTIVVKTIVESKSIFRGIIMQNGKVDITKDADTLEETIFEIECRLRDLA